MAKNLRVRVEVFPARMEQLANARGGPPDRLLQGLAQRVLRNASEEVGKEYSGHHIERGEKLKDSGRVEPSQGKGVGWSVVFDHPIALLHHEGHNKNYLMPQKSPKDAKPFYVRRGPGGYSFGPVRGPIKRKPLKGNPYLVEGAAKAGINTRSNPRFGRLRGEGGRFTRFLNP